MPFESHPLTTKDSNERLKDSTCRFHVGKDATIYFVLSVFMLLLRSVNRVRLCATPYTAAHQAPLSLGFSRKEHWVGCRFLLQCMKVKSESEVAQSCPTLATPWTTAYQAPPSMGFSRQKYWSGVPLPSPSVFIGSAYFVCFQILKMLAQKCLEYCLFL